MADSVPLPPLIIAIRDKKMVVCRRLIDTKEDNVNGDRDQNGNTALHYASFSGNLEKAELLTSSGADVNIINKYGQTALHCASIA